MDDPQEPPQPARKNTHSAKPRSVRPPARVAKHLHAKPHSAESSTTGNSSDAAGSDASKDDPKRDKGHDAGHHDGGHGSGEPDHSDDKQKSPTQRLISLLLTWIVLLIVSGALEKITDWSGEAKEHLTTADKAAVRALSRMQPMAISADFYTRLLAQHGFALYQWQAPLNADVARDHLKLTVSRRYPRLTLRSSILLDDDSDKAAQFTDKNGTVWHVMTLADAQRSIMPRNPFESFSALESRMEDHPIKNSFALPATNDIHLTPEDLTHAEREFSLKPMHLSNPPPVPSPLLNTPPPSPEELAQQQQDNRECVAYAAAMRSGLARIDRYTVTQLSHAGGYGVIIAVAMGLPDAYLHIIGSLLPRGSLIVQAAIAVFVFLLARMMWLRFDDKKDGWTLFFIVVGLPLAVSLIAWVIRVVALAAATKLGSYLEAPTLSVTASMGASPFVRWAGGKITEHHLFELLSHRVRHMLLKEAAEE